MKLQKYCRLARTVSTCRMAIHRRGSLSKGTKLKLKDHMVFIRRRIENEGPNNRIYTEQNRGNVMYSVSSLVVPKMEEGIFGTGAVKNSK